MKNPMTKMIRSLLPGLLLAALAGSVWAAGEPVPWNSLSSAQQKILAKLTRPEQWDRLPAGRQQRLLKGLRAWRKMSPEERAWAKRRFQQWKKLPPKQRARIRRRFEAYLSLSPEQRKWVKAQYQRFKKMPPEKRKALRKKWKGMSEQERLRALQNQKNPQGLPPPERRRLLEKLFP
ncbi:MAG TPA: DUF3106 domain-containing protein [Sedimenticola sp.]|nr:DUF3106 domain-containing protein [Sedimenticola sp.]